MLKFTDLEFSETFKKDEVVYGRGGVSFNSYVTLDKDIDIDLDADVNKSFDIDTKKEEPENKEPCPKTPQPDPQGEKSDPQGEKSDSNETITICFGPFACSEINL